MQLKFNKDLIFISIDFNVRVLSPYHSTFDTIFWKIDSSKRKVSSWHFTGTWNRTKIKGVGNVNISCFTIVLCLFFCTTSYQTLKLIIYIWVVQYGHHHDSVDRYGLFVSQKVTNTWFVVTTINLFMTFHIFIIQT